MTSRLVLLSTTHRVPPGVLSWPAWEALRTAGRVLAGDPEHPQRRPVEAAGVTVEVLPAATPGERAAGLLDLAARSDAPVVWLAGTDGDPGLGEALAAEVARRAARGEPVPEIEVLHGSYDLPGARVLDLVAVMDRLRSPGGCPWDAEQTHASLVKYLLEEAYELVEVIESGDRDALREELGDVLLQVVFHSRIAEEHPDEPWSIDDVAAGIVEKLIRRHPHVFGDVHAPTAEHVEANWEKLKAAEKQRASVVEGVPLAQPALSLASKLMQRVEKAGLAVETPGEVAVPAEVTDESLGDLLLAVVALARRHGIDPEAALRAAARRYRARVIEAEQAAASPP
ncbi:Nucleoside triphosphate pyrophosphohydrolase MazG [Carbonactinospora thermoautotrophica]|uniref:Nucleoside triphosphate pyrophosphohydrolase MazG n=2 Tax=Carbonactinospora thermoautotrophica TaxID=1469144 RepID=A0A132MMN5_9ACTN|nr:MazG family protein [Carbonactinospora thermoautotrophica]KWW99112.1 Nucleoside triphosphate pyrophosphohydrolase MazG [Carbonactinospora thermoautotrophica]